MSILEKKTDFELLLFERHHTKCLKKIIAIKNIKIEILANELKLVKENEFADTVVIVNEKDNRRIQRIKELESRLEYFRKRYNRLLFSFESIKQ